MNEQKYNLDDPSVSASIQDRIKYLIKLTRHTQASFSGRIGVDPASLSRILSGKAQPTDSFLNRIVVNMGVSKRWLVEGSDVPFPRQEANVIKEGAPVYNIDVTAGSTPLSRAFTEEHIVGFVKLPGLNPELPIVRVSGNSMEPKIHSGSYISIRNVSLDAPISWGRIYVVVLADFRLVKYVRRHPDHEMVILHSANPDFDDIEIRRTDIEALYLVENIINHDFLA